MPTTYTLTAPVSFPTAITLPSDGDGPGIKAADVTTPLEGLADAAAWLKAHANAVDYANKVVLTAAGPTVVVAPATAIGALLIGWGAGGAGAGGEKNGATHQNSVGGGAGAGAVRSEQIVTIVGGDSYSVAVGTCFARGAGAVSGISAATNGSNGDDSTVTHVSGGAVIARFKGGGGGGIGLLGSSAPDSLFSFAPGGQPCGSGTPPPGVSTADHSAMLSGSPQAGGRGAGGTLLNSFPTYPALRGNNSPEGFTGGAAGAKGLDDTTFIGGGPGGGGGAGPAGNGGVGGDGGQGNSGGVGITGTNGADAAANSGAGGGGGGASGGGLTGGNGGLGGLGGSGQVTIVWILSGAA